MAGRLTDKNPCNNCNLYNPCTGPCDKWHKWNSSMLSKLAAYETAEEEGRVIMLPCKIGSAVYLICHRYTECSKYGECFEEYSCSGCEEWDCDSRKEYYIHINQSVSLEWIVRNMRMENFGKTVFLTMEEAEKALKAKRESDGYIINKRKSNSRTP